MSRYGAATIRFGVSCMLFVPLVYVVAFAWYPDFLFELDGGWQGLRIILAIDLVLGSVLTLVVFKSGKRGLTFDLVMIGAIQAVCLGVGTWVVYSERPIAMVFLDGQFFSVNGGDYIDEGVEVPNLDSFPGPYPKWVTVKMPEDFEEQSTLRLEMIHRGVPLRLAVNRYAPFDSFATLAPLPIDLGEPPANVSTIPADPPSTSDRRWQFFPFGARYATGFIAFDTLTGAHVALVADQTPGRAKSPLSG